MSNEPISQLLVSIDQAYDRASWHGTNLRGSLRGVSVEEASWRPAPGRHNIWELALHCAYWKYAARRQMLGEPKGTFPYPGSDFFPRPDPASPLSVDRAWAADLAVLAAMHKSLRAAIEGLSAEDLAGKARGRKERRMLDIAVGVAAHDLYHAGQIQLLRRLREGSEAGESIE